MCLIACAWRAHADWPLVMAGNRDEFYARPTAAADWWTGCDLLAGRDLKAGGTWMGVARNGRLAALTNYRDPASQRPEAPSRGALVEGFVTSAEPAEIVLSRIAADAHRFNGFNLLAGDATGLWIVGGPDGSQAAPVAPGVHGLSNARLDTPWPKVGHAVSGLRAALASATTTDDLVDRLFTMLGDRTIASDDALPHTGFARETERALSPSFIRMPGYGTRASTVVIVERTGRTTFVERRCEPDQPVDARRFVFDR